MHFLQGSLNRVNLMKTRNFVETKVKVEKKQLAKIYFFNTITNKKYIKIEKRKNLIRFN